MKKPLVFRVFILAFIGCVCGFKLADTADKNPIKIPAGHMTQSEAHLSVPDIKAKVQSWYDIDNPNTYVRSLWDRVVARERQFNDTHYVFYNAFTSEWRVPQDLYLKLYAAFHPVTFDINTVIFRAFRWLPVDHTTPQEFIKKAMREHGMVNDVNWYIKKDLLSTNLALFGNVGMPLECSFEYYLTAQSHEKVKPAIFKEILDLFGISYKYLPRIETLASYLQGEPITVKNKTYRPQTLSQIFIPKQFVDEVAYLSWRQGVPYDAQMVDWVKNKLKKQHKLVPVLDEVTALFKDKQESHPIFKQVLEGIEQGRYRISTALDAYKTNPGIIPGLNNLQARLIITPKYMRNVGSGVQVFDYDTISVANKKSYESQFNALIEEMLTDFLARNAAQSGQPAGALDRLAKAFKSI